jgi:3-hydroxybutyryl-CoA dehydrogenase
MFNFQHAAVLGTGMMGPGIAATLALGGVSTTLVSRAAATAAQGLLKAQSLVDFLAANDLVTQEQAAAVRPLLTASAAFDETVSGADLVVESLPENLEFKQQLFARMDALARPAAVLASNTSGLSITAIASACAHPERVLTTHFWNPPHLMPLVEVVKGERTSDEAAGNVFALFEACGKTPVLVKRDRPGQLGNRLQMALFREAANIVAEGIADASAVDTVAKNGFGLRMPAYGIFEHIDTAGVDLATSVVDYVVRDLYNEPRAPDVMREMVRRGDLGVRTGKGFYDWSSKSAEEVKSRRDAFLIEVLKYRRKTPPPRD